MVPNTNLLDGDRIKSVIEYTDCEIYFTLIIGIPN